MQRVIMKSKIHRATVTRSVVDFDGSCGIAPDLMRAAGNGYEVAHAQRGTARVATRPPPSDRRALRQTPDQEAEKAADEGRNQHEAPFRPACLGRPAE